MYMYMQRVNDARYARMHIFYGMYRHDNHYRICNVLAKR